MWHPFSEKEKGSYLYLFGITPEHVWGFGFKCQRGFWKRLVLWQRPQLWKQLEFFKIRKSQLFMTTYSQNCHPTAEPPEGVGWMSPSASRISWVPQQQFLLSWPSAGQSEECLWTGCGCRKQRSPPTTSAASPQGHSVVPYITRAFLKRVS